MWKRISKFALYRNSNFRKTRKISASVGFHYKDFTTIEIQDKISFFTDYTAFFSAVLPIWIHFFFFIFEKGMLWNPRHHLIYILLYKNDFFFARLTYFKKSIKKSKVRKTRVNDTLISINKPLNIWKKSSIQIFYFDVKLLNSPLRLLNIYIYFCQIN